MARLVPLSDSLTRSGDSFHVSTCHSMTYPIKGPDMLRICAMKTEGHAAPPHLSQGCVLEPVHRVMELCYFEPAGKVMDYS